MHLIHTPTFSLVLPCLNEEATIGKIVKQSCSWMQKAGFTGEIIVVNNGSSDGTTRILGHLQKQIPQLRIINIGKTVGYGECVMTGCDAATMDLVAYMDSDGQLDVQEFSKLLPYLYSVDFVSGIRANRHDLFIRKVNSFCWNMLMRMALGIRAKDIDCGMKAFRRKIWRDIRPKFSKGIFLPAEMFYRVKKNKYSWAQETVRHFPRLHGKATGAQLRVILRAFLEFGLLFWREIFVQHLKPDQYQRIENYSLPLP